MEALSESWLELGALFLSAFVSATILPGTSEAVLIGVLATASAAAWAAVGIATIGNLLGSMLNWAIGKYLASFRDHGGFHEECTIDIGKRLVTLLKPRWLRIGGYWYPRGGMPIDVFWQSGRLPAGVWLPDQGVAPYRGRG